MQPARHTTGSTRPAIWRCSECSSLCRTSTRSTGGDCTSAQPLCSVSFQPSPFGEDVRSEGCLAEVACPEKEERRALALGVRRKRGGHLNALPSLQSCCLGAGRNHPRIILPVRTALQRIACFSAPVGCLRQQPPLGFCSVNTEAMTMALSC